MMGLEEFNNVLCLVPSISKSAAFFCNVPNALKATILNSMPFAEGSLPVRYLGVPLICLILLYRDCKTLMEKLKSRINDWRNKFLSIVGRLQLVRSVLSFMHIYWASVFILPPHIIYDLEQLMRSFLWCQGKLKKGKAKVAWESVRKPKLEGGMEAVNTACYTQNRSLIRLRYNKTSYELMHDKKPDLSYLYVFGSMCYPTNDSEDLRKLKAKEDIVFSLVTLLQRRLFFSSRPAPKVMTLETLSSGLVPNPIPQPPYVPPTKNDWDILFQPMFDEFFNPPPSVVSLVSIAAA
nr:hypothetical protein [Tanacetum cinerariifolium]